MMSVVTEILHIFREFLPSARQRRIYVKYYTTDLEDSLDV